MSNSSNSFHPQSGHPGVTWCSERRTWRICYAPEPGKRVTKSFNPRHYGGLEQARQAAVEYLREQKAKLSLYKPSGGNGSNSSKSENSNSSVNLKKMNDMRHPTTSAIDINVNNNINNSNSNKLMKSSNGNSKWSSTYNGFEFSHCNNNNMGISNENNSDGKINVNGTNNHLFGIENTSNEQWNVAAAAVIAHAINTSKNSGFSQKRKSIYEHSSSLGVPSNKSSKSSNTHNGMYEDNLMYFNSHINNNNHCIEGQNYCECCYSPSQYKNRQTLQSCQYSCSCLCSESNCNSNYKVPSIPISNNHPFICEGNDPNSLNDLMNIRTPKYVSYQRQSTNNQEDSLHPSIASSSPLGRMFQSTPYQNLDNYDNILTPYMRINQSIGQNGTSNRFNANSYENNESNPTGCNLNTNSNSLFSNSNQSMISSGNYSCYNLNSNYVNDQSNDIHSPYSCWFEGLGSCYSEIEDTFLSKTNSNSNLHLPPIGSLGPYSFQPFKEYSSNDNGNGNKSIVENVLLPLSITTCSTSAEPQLSNELLIEPYRGTSTFPNSTDK